MVVLQNLILMMMSDEEFNGMRFHVFSKNYERVCDHCHYTAEYREVAHSVCN